MSKFVMVLLMFFPHGAKAVVNEDALIEAARSHPDTPHSAGLLWANDQLDAETST
jgi:hypothetical protein